jgi:hypothetical protein
MVLRAFGDDRERAVAALVTALSRPPAPTPSATPVAYDVSWDDAACWCRDHDGGRLNENERGLINNLTVRAETGRRPTEKQLRWLTAIFTRLQRGSRQ